MLLKESFIVGLSATLFFLFLDIETAFYFGHPVETEYRLHELQVRCFLQTGKTLEAQVSISPTFYEQLLCSQITRVKNNTDYFTVILRFWHFQSQRMCVNMLVKLTSGGLWDGLTGSAALEHEGGGQNQV
jgi:hypothetical protein